MGTDARSRPARISDVAAAAGVSPTTVSHALSGKGRVDPATVTRVRDVATRLGYTPNQTARNLRRGRNGLIALMKSVDPDMPTGLTDLDHFVRLVIAASETALARGYPLILAPPGDPAALDRTPLDGIIILDPVTNDPLLRYARVHEVPTVTIGRDPGADRGTGNWVDNDLGQATESMLDHLEARGAEHVALITSPPVHSWGIDIVDGYRAWASRRSMPERIVVAGGTPTESAGYAAATELLTGGDRPDAIHCVIDRYALGTLLVAQMLGLRVPADLLVSAGTDSEPIRTATPTVTALELHPEIARRCAAEILISQLEEGTTRQQLVVPADLIPRLST